MTDEATIVHLDANSFGELALKALGDDTLRQALDHATGLFGELRQAAVDSMEDWEDLRERGRAIKEEALSRLDFYLEQLVENAERNGTVVHFARDRAEACRILAEVAERVGAETVVKSKSMTTEEIGLNAALEERGLLPVETDLGEWIIQLAGEMPSHIIAPAIHKTKEQIAQLFRDELGAQVNSDVQDLAAYARKMLRRSFAEADLGISGVNFAIAETGSFLVLENEGNARLTTSLPRVHVAVMGIEKVIPRLADLPVFLRLLPRSGTGQHLTSYQSLFTGPKRSPEDEGPEELHLLILDNGRAAMLGEALTRQSLACIRCGACLNACPVYKQVGGHAYGSVYPGPIGSVITPQLAGIEKARVLPFASTLCAACRDVCPVKIDIPSLLLHLRSRLVEQGGQPAKARARERRAFRLWAWTMEDARRFRWAARLARFALRGPLRGVVRRLLPPLAAWTAGRELRPPARRSFRQLWRADSEGRRE